jgi:mRNA deadenylase 3'-5' endonuclease subunit Ccr4
MLKRTFSRVSANKSSDNNPPFRADIDVSVMQFNVLAPCLGDPARFSSVEPSDLDGPARMQRVVAMIADLKPDVVCVQEAQVGHLESEMTSLGYKCHFARGFGKTIRVGIFAGPNFVVTKSESVSVVEPETVGSQVALFVTGYCLDAFRRGYPKSLPLTLCVTHLKALKTFKGEEIRLLQVNRMMLELERFCQGDVTRVIIAADLNAQPVFDKARGIEPLAYTAVLENPTTNFASAMRRGGPVAAEPEFTTLKHVPDGERCMCIDYIFHTSDVELVATLDMPARNQIPCTGLPCSDNPSDHVPLMAKFRLPIAENA